MPPLPTPSGATTTATTQPDIRREYIERAAWKQGVLGAMNVAAQILAARLIVLIAVVGGIGLSWQALGDPNPSRAIVLAIYALLVVGPTVWLASR